MTGRFRVYFNRRGAPMGKVWCVDRGEGTRRMYFASVTFDEGTSDYNGREPDWKNPVAWMNCEGKLNVWRSAGARHASITSRFMLLLRARAAKAEKAAACRA